MVRYYAQYGLGWLHHGKPLEHNGIVRIWFHVSAIFGWFLMLYEVTDKNNWLILKIKPRRHYSIDRYILCRRSIPDTFSKCKSGVR